MKRIPLEQRLRAAVTGDTFFLGAFCLLPNDYFNALRDMTGKECFMERYSEFAAAFPEYDCKILAQIVYEVTEQSNQHCLDLLYVMLVEPFANPTLSKEREVEA